MASTAAFRSVSVGGSVVELPSGRGASRRRAPRGRLITRATLACALLVIVGWPHRDESTWVADEGAGYLLGIVGLS